MSLSTVQEATSQPATPVANTEEKKGGTNISSSDFARRLVASQVAAAAAAPKTESVAVPNPPTTEAKEAPTPEATTEAPKTEAAQAEPGDGTEEEADEVLSPENNSLDPKKLAGSSSPWGLA